MWKWNTQICTSEKLNKCMEMRINEYRKYIYISSHESKARDLQQTDMNKG